MTFADRRTLANSQLEAGPFLNRTLLRFNLNQNVRGASSGIPLPSEEGTTGRGAARADDAQGTPTQSHISPSILVYEDKVLRTFT